MLKTDIALGALPLSLQKALSDIPSSKRLLVALSGGLDSVVLLHSAKALAQQTKTTLLAIHVNHGLSPHADDWQKYCAQLCKKLNIDIVVKTVSVVRNGEGLEAAARNARYQAFAEVMHDGDVMLQGHHQNDQAETVLMRVMRGAGPEALAAIPRRRTLVRGELFRPFLSIPRAMLEEVARQHDWEWIEDESNQDLAFDRNYVRHRVLPALEARWSTTLESLAQVAERAAQAQHLIDAWCQSNFSDLKSARYPEHHALDLKVLARFDAIQQRALLRYWLDCLAVAHPAGTIFERVWSELIPAALDAQPLLQWGLHQLRRYDHCIFYTREPDSRPLNVSHQLYEALSGTPLTLKLCESLSVHIMLLSAGQPIPENALIIKAPVKQAVLSFRSRQGGEKLQLEDRHVSLKKLFQAEGMPPWERDRQVLLFVEDDLVAAGSEYISSQWRPQVGQPALAVVYAAT